MIRHFPVARCCGAAALAFGAAVAVSVALGLLAPRPGAAQSSNHPGDTLVFQGGAGEIYIAGLPSGWSLELQESNEYGHQLEWVPADQAVQGWRDMIAYQLLPKPASPKLDDMAPDSFLDSIAAFYAETCDQVLATDIEGAVSNGFPAALRVLACTKNKVTGLGEVTLFRAIKGDRAFYVAQRAWRMDPFTPETVPISGEQLDGARKLIEFGLACHREEAERPCPAGWRPVLDTLDGGQSAIVYKAVP